MPRFKKQKDHVSKTWSIQVVMHNLEKESKLNINQAEGKKQYRLKDINEIENRKTMEKINETKNWFFEKVQQKGQTARLIEKKYKKTMLY